MAVVAVMAPPVVKVARKVETMAVVVAVVVVATAVDAEHVVVAVSERRRGSVNALTQKASRSQPTLLPLTGQRPSMRWALKHPARSKARTAHHASVEGAADEEVAVATNAPTTPNPVR